MTDYERATTAAAAARIADSTHIGLDTEFMRERTYFAQLCLLQLAVTDGILCVDPLADEPTDDFWDALNSPTWVLHAGRQDLEVLYLRSRRMPSAVFDTQVAAGLVGLSPQLGYAALVNELFDVELPKSHTRADWSRRPLSDAMLRYAAEDVLYLMPAYDRLGERLEALGRRAWADEDSAWLLSPELYETAPGQAIDRLKGARNLRGGRRKLAARLAAWRERRAIAADKPRQWILRDAALLEIALQQPADTAALARIDGIPPGLVRRTGKELIDLVQGGNGAGSAPNVGDDDERDAGDGRQPAARPDAEQRRQLKEMQALVARRAADLGISAELLASRRDLTALVQNGRADSRLFGGWRRAVVGDDLQRLL